MPKFTVEVEAEIDTSDILQELSDEELIAEMQERELNSFSIKEKRQALQLLKDCADFLRDKDKPALALGLDDLMKQLGLV